MITFQNVFKSYDDQEILKNINLSIADNKLTVLIGPSGCGKSTSLRLINRMIEPSAGKILINDDNIRTLSPEVLRRKIGYVIQNVGLLPHMTVEQNIAIVPKLLKWDKAKWQSRVLAMLKLIGLKPDIYAQKYPHELSGGEAQRVGVARALAGDPPIILMDEPFAAVDSITRNKLQNEFSSIQKDLKKTIIFVTHDMDEAIKLADHIIILKDGQVLQDDGPEEILKNPKNKFVHNFIGKDRALKKLSRLYVRDYLIEAKSIKLPNSNANMQALDQDYYWLINDGDVLCGWIHKDEADNLTSIEDANYNYHPDEISVKAYFTLREAFSKLLEQGIENIAVTDKQNRLIGEISLKIIQDVLVLGNNTPNIPKA